MGVGEREREGYCWFNMGQSEEEMRLTRLGGKEREKSKEGSQRGSVEFWEIFGSSE
ncbi:hypothetical protein SESBI_03204 [Sesbania bispinosa]|nr:hypothetical protein SESBI_03204 [Sesbania bispinosa]